MFHDILSRKLSSRNNYAELPMQFTIYTKKFFFAEFGRQVTIVKLYRRLRHYKNSTIVLFKTIILIISNTIVKNKMLKKTELTQSMISITLLCFSEIYLSSNCTQS